MRRKLSEKSFIAFILALIGLVALSTATFAWLGVSRIPFISDISLSLITDSGILIAPDVDGRPGEWTRYLDTSAYLENTVPLRPATYLPDGFYMVNYEETGRTCGVSPLSEENFNVKFPEGASSLEASQAAAEQGVMIYLDLWFSAEGNSADVYLSPPKSTPDGQLEGGTYAVGTPEWDETLGEHVNTGYGSETAVRFGFEWYTTDVNGNPVTEPTFVIYEPNADVHIDNSEGYKATNSVNGGSLIDDEHLITQAASTWQETEPRLVNEVVYTPGAFLQDQRLMRIERSGLTRCRIYAWMEGQDPDCIAAGVAEAVHLTANLDFFAHVDAEGEGTGIGRRNIER